MVGKNINFKSGYKTAEGEILEKYRGYKLIDIALPGQRIRELVSIDFYIVKVEDSFHHIPCSEVEQVK